MNEYLDDIHDKPHPNHGAAMALMTDRLRRIHPDAWAEITEPNGWTYHTNIGRLAHKAADEIERLQKEGKL